jgi:hypothetical protein
MEISIKKRLLTVSIILLYLLIKSFINVPENIQLNLVTYKNIHPKQILSKYNPSKYSLPMGKATFKIEGFNYFQRWLAPTNYRYDKLRLVLINILLIIVWVYVYKNKINTPNPNFSSLGIKLLAYGIILYSVINLFLDRYYSVLVSIVTENNFKLDYNDGYINQNIWLCVALIWMSKMYKQVDVLQKENALTI